MNWKNKKGGPPFEGVYPYLMALFIGYIIADLAILYVRPYMLPGSAPAGGPPNQFRSRPNQVPNYDSIARRNIFSEKNLIPDALKAEGTSEENEDGQPVPSQLPLTLVGTIVFTNPERSIATIELRGQNKVLPFSVGDEIDSIAKLTKVERHKAIFRNLRTARLEYIEIKDANKLSFNRSKPTAKNTGSKEVVQAGQNQFEVKRADLMKYTSNLGEVLQQARAVPNRDPRTGELNGFKLLDMNPDSIFGQLGLTVGDVLKGVNGENIKSPAEAMKAYQALKDSDEIRIMIERDGREEELVYRIRQ